MNKYKKLINDYIALSKQIIDTELRAQSILDDPMNGCPDDFAELFGRKIANLEFELESEILPDMEKIPKGIRQRIDTELEMYEEARWENEISTLPWYQ